MHVLQYLLIIKSEELKKKKKKKALKLTYLFFYARKM